MSDLLTALVSIYSPSEHEAPAVACLVDWMNAHGFAAERDAAGNAVGVRGAADAPHTLMLLGHIDTFPGVIPVRVERDVLYGRGSVDAKGSLCAFAEAAAGAVVPEGWRVVVVGAVEEESASSRGARFVRDTFTPSLCVIGEPSGARRVTLGYKGRLVLDYTLTRPSEHSARPDASVGARGAAFWAAVLAWAAEQNAGYERFFDQVMPNLARINTSSDHFYDRVALTIGFRLPPRLAPDVVLAAVSALAQEGTVKGYAAEAAYQTDKSSALVRAFVAAVRAQGGRPDYVLKTGTSDMNVVGARWTCPMVAYGPGDSALDHTPDEHLPLDEYRLAVATLRRVIEGLAVGV